MRSRASRVTSTALTSPWLTSRAMSGMDRSRIDFISPLVHEGRHREALHGHPRRLPQRHLPREAHLGLVGAEREPVELDVRRRRHLREVELVELRYVGQDLPE